MTTHANPPVAFRPIYLEDVPNVSELPIEERANQHLIHCPCGEYYYYDVPYNTLPAYFTSIVCPCCGSKDRSRMRMHSGGYFNAGTIGF